MRFRKLGKSGKIVETISEVRRIRFFLNPALSPICEPRFLVVSKSNVRKAAAVAENIFPICSEKSSEEFEALS